MILTDGPKMVLTPTYHLFKMYVPFQGAKRLPISFDAGTYKFGEVSVPRIDAIAARGTDGKLWIALTNVDPNKIADIDVALEGIRAKRASGTVLTAARVDAVNTYDKPDEVEPQPISAKVTGGRLKVTVPAKSVTVLSVTE